jgi:glycosyltransferase involved in cell wall biosynthesis
MLISNQGACANELDLYNMCAHVLAARTPNFVTIVCITRLVYRKGVDLMVEVIPAICRKFEHVNFVIGGDGPMRVVIEQMRENHQLQVTCILKCVCTNTST